MSDRKTSSLKREIVLLLIVKLALIVVIKLAFFSDPLRPGPEEAARHLLHAPHSGETTHE
jgi:hypothetical protein